MTQRNGLGQIEPRGFYSQYAQLSRGTEKGETKALCPLHEEKTPSFFVNLKTGSFKCFGCGAGGGPVEFYAAYHHISRAEAEQELARKYNVAGPGRRKRRSTDKATEEKTAQDSTAARISSIVAHRRTSIYSTLLGVGRPLSPHVLEYFVGRGVEAETLERFCISYLADTRRAVAVLEKSYSIEELMDAGVFSKNEDGKPFFLFRNHPLLFPILENGEPIWLQGRRFPENPAVPKYCNLAGVPVPTLLNVDGLRGLDPKTEVFLCEGAPDTMSLNQAGFPAVGIVGSSGFKQEWVAPLRQFRVTLALDSDTAGREGTERVVCMFHEEALPVRVLSLPPGVKDLNDFFLTHEAGSFAALALQAQKREADLCSIVRRLLVRVSNRRDRFSYPDLGEVIYSWFENHGGVFLVDGRGRCLLMFRERLYQIGGNPYFDALMMSETGLLSLQYQGRMVWSVLKSLCLLRGRREPNLSWAYESDGSLYINLHDPAHHIVRLGDRDVTVMLNGSNDRGIMLRSADKMEPIEYDPEVNPKESIELLRRLVLEPLACEPENRLFVTCWILTAFFLDFTAERPLLKLSGHTGCGKTTAARVMSCLLYGADYVEWATVAYYYADAAQNPFLTCDNLETDAMNRDIVGFLLQVATGIVKGKRRAGTDSETVREVAKALVAITAIEPLTQPELINRTYDIEFRSIFKRPGFMQLEHMRNLTEQRSRILSGLFKLFAWEVLPNLGSRRGDILKVLQERHARHPKQRVDSFLTVMILILSALLKLLEPGRDRTWEIVDWWVRYQGRLAEETERDTNVGLYLLEALGKEMLAKDGEFRKEYYINFKKTVSDTGEPRELTFVATSRDLLMALQILSRNKGFKLPFSNAQQLGVRLANEADVLGPAGWCWEREKIVHGTRYHRFTKRWSQDL